MEVFCFRHIFPFFGPLLRIDRATPGVAAAVGITGLQSGEALQGIDFRLFNGVGSMRRPSRTVGFQSSLFNCGMSGNANSTRTNFY